MVIFHSMTGINQDTKPSYASTKQKKRKYSTPAQPSTNFITSSPHQHPES
jgi:hypothetical protein